MSTCHAAVPPLPLVLAQHAPLAKSVAQDQPTWRPLKAPAIVLIV
jgi:hypothetical protein